eukprot:scaffold260185_cov33-Tisochrysis_lutea.AAC.4
MARRHSPALAHALIAVPASACASAPERTQDCMARLYALVHGSPAPTSSIERSSSSAERPSLSLAERMAERIRRLRERPLGTSESSSAAEAGERARCESWPI